MEQKNTLGGLKAAFLLVIFIVSSMYLVWLIAYFVYTCHCTSGCGSQSFVDFFKKRLLISSKLAGFTSSPDMSSLYNQPSFNRKSESKTIELHASLLNQFWLLAFQYQKLTNKHYDNLYTRWIPRKTNFNPMLRHLFCQFLLFRIPTSIISILF